jgi:hypothetical protein
MTSDAHAPIDNNPETNDAAKKIQGVYRKKRASIAERRGSVVTSIKTSDDANVSDTSAPPSTVASQAISATHDGPVVIPSFINMPPLPSGIRLMEARDAHSLWLKAHRKGHYFFSAHLIITQKMTLSLTI